VPEKESASLNRAYRGKNKPANVLSFRYGKEYGEIIVCPAVIRREAQEQKRAFQYQMTWMILHGMIHLSGLHHEASAAAAKRVERLEQSILGILFTDSKSKN
jgi:probable rRNA maturation factor